MKHQTRCPCQEFSEHFYKILFFSIWSPIAAHRAPRWERMMLSPVRRVACQQQGEPLTFLQHSDGLAAFQNKLRLRSVTLNRQ
jgi:hypothetical protein